MGPDAMIFVFWIVSFKPTFSLSSFTFIKRLFSSSSLSAIRVMSSAYLRLLIFLPAILIPAYASSSPAFLMMYSSYKLNKQGDNMQPWRLSKVQTLPRSLSCIFCMFSGLRPLMFQQVSRSQLKAPVSLQPLLTALTCIFFPFMSGTWRLPFLCVELDYILTNS